MNANPPETKPNPWQPELDELAQREAFAEKLGGEMRVKRQHDGGRYTIRERIDLMLDRQIDDLSQNVPRRCAQSVSEIRVAKRHGTKRRAKVKIGSVQNAHPQDDIHPIGDHNSLLWVTGPFVHKTCLYPHLN